MSSPTQYLDNASSKRTLLQHGCRNDMAGPEKTSTSATPSQRCRSGGRRPASRWLEGPLPIRANMKTSTDPSRLGDRPSNPSIVPERPRPHLPDHLIDVDDGPGYQQILRVVVHKKTMSPWEWSMPACALPHQRMCHPDIAHIHGGVGRPGANSLAQLIVASTERSRSRRGAGPGSPGLKQRFSLRASVESTKHYGYVASPFPTGGPRRPRFDA